jgi:hypothetical protein
MLVMCTNGGAKPMAYMCTGGGAKATRWMGTSGELKKHGSSVVSVASFGR